MIRVRLPGRAGRRILKPISIHAPDDPGATQELRGGHVWIDNFNPRTR